jgi:hypothetical protein
MVRTILSILIKILVKRTGPQRHTRRGASVVDQSYIFYCFLVRRSNEPLEHSNRSSSRPTFVTSVRTELTKVDEIEFGSSTPVLGSVTARENNKQIYSLSTCHFLPLTREAFEH